METMPLPDLPASFSRAATGIRRSSPCAAAAFFVLASQVITKLGDRGRPRAPFFRYRIPTRLEPATKEWPVGAQRARELARRGGSIL